MGLFIGNGAENVYKGVKVLGLLPGRKNFLSPVASNDIMNED